MMRYQNEIILSAHRGDRKNYPENTIPAFEAALEFGIEMLELDVHMTQDGELIVMHDRNTQRTTGHDGFTNEMTLEQVRSLDAGSLFSDRFTNTKVPTVQEFIDLVKDTDVLINWELKDYPHKLGDIFAFESADKLIALIEKYDLNERSMINTFSDRTLEYIYLKYSNKFTFHGQGILGCQKTNDQASIPQTELYDWCCLWPNVPGSSPLDFPENFEYCVSKNIYPCVCFADTMANYKKALELGCRMFTSNDIETAHKLLQELNVRE